MFDPTGLPSIVSPGTDVAAERSAMYSCLLENTTTITYGANVDFQVFDFDEDFCNRADTNPNEPNSDPAVGANICQATEEYYAANYSTRLGLTVATLFGQMRWAQKKSKRVALRRPPKSRRRRK